MIPMRIQGARLDITVVAATKMTPATNEAATLHKKVTIRNSKLHFHAEGTG